MTSSGTAGAAVARNAVHLVLGQAATTFVAVLLSAVLGRTLGPTDFGLYFFVVSMTTFALVVVEWGQGTYLTREVARAPGLAGTLLTSALVLRLGGGAAAVAVTAAATGLMGYDARTRALAALGVATAVPFFLSQACGAVFRGRERMDLDALVSVANKALALAFTLAALGLGHGLLGVLVAQGAAGALALALSASLTGRLDLGPQRPTGSAVRALLTGGTPIVAMTLAIAAQGYLDTIVLSKLAPREAMGWYGAARSVMGTLLAPATILGAAAFPRLSRAAQIDGELPLQLRAALRPLLGLGALASVGTFLFSDLAVTIVYGGEEFAQAGAILRVFAPGLFLLFVDVLLGTAVIAIGRADRLAMAKGLNVLVTTALDVLLVPWFQARYGNGGIGIVTAFAAGELAMFAALVWILPRGALDRATLVDGGRALVAGCATLLLFGALPALSPWVGVPGAVVVFAGVAVAFGLVRRSDAATVSQLVSERRGGSA